MCVFSLLDAAQKQYLGASPNPTSPRAIRMPGCMLITSSRSSNTVGSETSTNTPSKQGREHQAWVTGCTPFPRLHGPKVANGPFKWGLQHRLAGVTGCRASMWQTAPARETRAVHTADIHISEPNGTNIWVDVRVGMAKPGCSVPKELVRMEQEKRREYGQGQSNPSTLFDGVVAVIFEQHGCPSPCAITFLHHVLRRKVAKLEQSSHLTHGVAWMMASREFFALMSCILLVMHHQMFQECSPIVHTPDKPREVQATGLSNALSQPSSQGEPWPDAEPWQGQDTQLSLTSTQGVDPFS